MAKIIGNTTATPNPRPDWNQTDENKADYIKNKPEVLNPDWEQTDENRLNFIRNKPTLGGLASKDKVEKNDLSDEVQSSLGSADNAIPWVKRGAAGGVAELDENGKVPSAQLPSYVDDVLEYEHKILFPEEGETSKIYIDVSTNTTYRWGGSSYVAIISDIALGETSATAYRGDRGKIAYEHTLITGNPHNVTAELVGALPTINGKAAQGTTSTDDTLKNMNRFQSDVYIQGDGGAPNNPRVAGFYMGKSATDENRHIDIVSGAKYSYIDFNKANAEVDYNARLIVDVENGATEFKWGDDSTQKTFNIQGAIQQGGQSVALKGDIPDVSNCVRYTTNENVSIAGATKPTYTFVPPEGDNQPGNSKAAAYFPEGIIMGGTAQSAGFMVRGICGINSSDPKTGACTKDNLYINYDGNNDYKYDRQLVMQAGAVGTHYGNNVYQYAAVRGDALKGYCDANYVNVTGDTMTGALKMVASNPHIGFKDSGYDTEWHIQAHQDQFGFGPTWDKAIKSDKNGNLTASGSVKIGNAVTLEYDSTNECLNFSFK